MRSTSQWKMTDPFSAADAHSPASRCWSWWAWLPQHVWSSWADWPLLTKHISPNPSGSTLQAVCSTNQHNFQELESCLAEEKLPGRCLNPVKAQVPMPTRKGMPARPEHRPTGMVSATAGLPAAMVGTPVLPRATKGCSIFQDKAALQIQRWHFEPL